jgi:hypothetical protein
LLTSRSIRPKRSRAAATTAATSSGRPTSPEMASASRPTARTAAAVASSGARRRPQATTCAPARASSTAMARPIPCPAPVTMAMRSRRVSAVKATGRRLGYAVGADGPDGTEATGTMSQSRMAGFSPRG